MSEMWFGGGCAHVHVKSVIRRASSYLSKVIYNNLYNDGYTVDAHCLWVEGRLES